MRVCMYPKKAERPRTTQPSLKRRASGRNERLNQERPSDWTGERSNIARSCKRGGVRHGPRACLAPFRRRSKASQQRSTSTRGRRPQLSAASSPSSFAYSASCAFAARLRSPRDVMESPAAAGGRAPAALCVLGWCWGCWMHGFESSMHTLDRIESQSKSCSGSPPRSEKEAPPSTDHQTTHSLTTNVLVPFATVQAPPAVSSRRMR